jgi:hypothetical protein
MILFGLFYFFFSNFFFVIHSPISMLSEEDSSYFPHNEPLQENKNSVDTVLQQQIQFPSLMMPRIDIVYSYVNGSDPSRLKLKLDYLAIEKENQFSDADFENVGSGALARDNNELVFSLRSVNQYYKWFDGNIYIIADQIPNWLNTSHPQIHIVRSEDILPKMDVPTFNSHSIEANIHKIEGLSEYYLYFNDDYLLGADVPLSYYLKHREVENSKGMDNTGEEPDMCMTFHHDERETLSGDSEVKTDVVHYAAMRNVNALLDSKFQQRPRYFLPHAPHLFKRSALVQITKDFPKEFEKTSSSKFRSWTNIHTAYLFANYVVEDGSSCAEFRQMQNKCYFGQDYCIKLLRSFKDSQKFFNKLKNAENSWRFISINDHVPDESLEMEKIMKLFGDYLLWKYPSPSPWEKIE